MVSAKILVPFTISFVSILTPAAAQESAVAKNAFSPGSAPAANGVSPARPNSTIVPAANAPAPKQLTPEQRGDVFMARKMFRDAIDAYKQGPPDSPMTWNKIGIAYHQLGDLNAAKKNYEHAIRIDHKFADAVNNLGTIYYARKSYRAAISRYRKAIRLNPEIASFWSNLGTAYYSRGKFDDMFKAYARALELDPQVFEHRGTTGSEMQDRSVADRARYHFELARMYAHAGKNDLAIQYLRKSLEEGYKDKDKLREVPEFAALRDTDEFKELLELKPKVL
jgi:tetratricopeptide (TPR) repeat protein